MKTYTRYLFQPVNNSPLIAFRSLFGLVMAGECLKSIASCMVKHFYVDNTFNFTFIGFEWLNVLHGSMMYTYYAAMALCALCVAAGMLYRYSSVLLALMWTAVYLSQKTHYNNHYYLMALLCWLMAFMPANQRFASDVKLGLAKPCNECKRWQIHLFIFQVACMYFYSAVAKMNADWLHAIPLKHWLQHKTGLRFVGWSFRNPVMPWLIAYGGLLFDLLIVPGLLFRRSRLFCLVLSLCFHAFNGYVFKIGTFPFLAISLNVFFLPASLFDKALGRIVTTECLMQKRTLKQSLLACAIAVYVLLQLYLPLRHWLVKGDVMWTEEGHRMSWHMMLRSKTGTCYFKVVNKQNDSAWLLQPAFFFDSEQLRSIAVLPDVTWQAAQHLKDVYAKQKINVSIYAHNEVSLNFNSPQLLIDTTCDLANATWKTCGHNEWILLNK